MEEIDDIIIDTLKNINCDMDEDITNLKHFDPDLTLKAFITCLEAIDASAENIPKKFPSSMSQKIKIANNVVQQIQKIGFKGDIGYQTILYCNEIETRRILMFLLERLPRENTVIVTTEECDEWLDHLLSEIEEKLRLSLNYTDDINQFNNANCIKLNKFILPTTFGNSYPIIPKIVFKFDNASDTFNNLPVIIQHCKHSTLLMSLLFQENFFNFNSNMTFEKIKITGDFSTNFSKYRNVHDINKIGIDFNNSSNIHGILEQLNNANSELKETENAIAKSKTQINKFRHDKNMQEVHLENVQTQLNIKSKSLAVIANDEDCSKLQTVTKNSANKLIQMANQWNKVRLPLLNEYKSLQSKLYSQDSKLSSKQNRIKNLNTQYQDLLNDLHDKEILEKSLKRKLDKSKKTQGRWTYTSRIFEIIGNIRKQDEEIKNILQDTKDTQRHVNGITGQLDRSFTMADELIFQNAKYDETARSAYKLLVLLRDECNAIIASVTNLGMLERESRNLQDQIDIEMSKEISEKLKKVYGDLAEIRKETNTMLY